MYAAFVKLLNMSAAASILIAVVIALRFLLRKVPKKYICILWAVVALRLVCPISFSSAVSAYNYIGSGNDSTGQVEYIHYNGKSEKPKASVAIPLPAESEKNDGPTVQYAIKDFYVPTVLSFWVAGFAAMVVYAAISYHRVRVQVRESLLLPDCRNIYICDYIATPFILGVVKPKIYLPSTLERQQQCIVIAHERSHIARLDHWWKPLGFLLLSIHWFNPLVWIAYALLCRDIEMACDEKVIEKMSPTQKQAYSTVLLACSAPRKAITACPLAFGESGVKARVKGILNYRKPTFWVAAVSIVLCLVLAVGFLSNPVRTEDYLAFKRANIKGSFPHTYHFQMQAGEDVRSPVIFAELWQNGTLLQSEYGTIPESVRDITLTMTDEDGSYRMQLETKPNVSTMDFSFQLPENAILMDIYDWHGAKDIALVPDKEVLLTAYIFDCSGGGFFIFDFDNEDYALYGDRLRNQDCALIVYSVYPAKTVQNNVHPSFTQEIYQFSDELLSGYTLKPIWPYWAGLYKNGELLGRISATDVSDDASFADILNAMGYDPTSPALQNLTGADPDWDFEYLDGDWQTTHYLHRVSGMVYDLMLDGVEHRTEIKNTIVPRLRKFLTDHPNAITPTYTYMLLTGEGDIATIRMTRKDHSGGSVICGYGTYAEKSVVWLEPLESMLSISGVTLQALNADGEIVWAYSVPEELGTAQRIQDGNWVISRDCPEGYEEITSPTLEQRETPGSLNVLLRPTTAIDIDGMGAYCPANQDEWIAAWNEVQNSEHTISEFANAESYYGVVLHYNDIYLNVHQEANGLVLREMGGSHSCYSAEASKPLIALLEPILKEFSYSPVKPVELKGIQYASLLLDGEKYFIDQGDPKLQQLEAILTSGTPIGYMPACWFTSLLTVVLPSGETKTISVATDSCGSYLSDGVCYEFPGDNAQLYQLFGITFNP